MASDRYMLNVIGRYLAALLLPLALIAPSPAHGAPIAINNGVITTFSSGMDFPETITPVPQGFGSYGGEYFVLDATRNFNVAQTRIWAVPAGGGAPSVFAGPLPIIPIGGLFLPSSGWGAYSGNFLVSGEDGIYAFDSLGQATKITSVPGQSYFVPALAPASFGSHAGEVMIAAAVDPVSEGIFSLTPAGNVPLFAPVPQPFGVAFAPAGFGSVGGTLLVGSGSGAFTPGLIYSVNSDGSFGLYFSFDLRPGEVGATDIAFSPPGFFPGVDKPLLFVSVSGSDPGGGFFGTLGDIKVFDDSCTPGVPCRPYASLRDDLGLTKFDPRGMYFSSDGLLVSDTTDPIYLLQPGAFELVPEPATLALVLFGLALAVAGSGVPRR